MIVCTIFLYDNVYNNNCSISYTCILQFIGLRSRITLLVHAADVVLSALDIAMCVVFVWTSSVTDVVER